MTFRQLSALLDRWEFVQKRLDYRAGVIAATIVNASATSKRRKTFKPEDFFPSLSEKARRKPQTWQQQLQIVEMLNAAFGGKDLRNTDALSRTARRQAQT